jgi:acyl-CoA thioesterase
MTCDYRRVNIAELIQSMSPAPAGGFTVEVPEDWQQGRTLYGGLNAALAAEAARRVGGDAPRGPLRALQIAFMAPSSGTVRYEATILRAGRSVTFVGVDITAGDALCHRAILTYGAARDSDLRHQRLTAPEVPPPEECPAIATDTAPVFLQHMELRFAAGSPPLSGGEPEFSMWVRHRGAEGLDPEIALLAIGDVLPPAVMASRTEFRPASSITWSIDLSEIPADPAGWYLLSTTSDQASDGYSAQAMSAFGPGGRLAAVSRQTVAAF